MVAPSKNVTVPVGVPEAATVVVKVTLWPAVDGLFDEVIVVVVAGSGAFTVCVNADDVLAA